MKKQAMRVAKSAANTDVVLCTTYNRPAGKRVCDTLIRDEIPFTKIWKRIPFFLRELYHGRDEVCVISINRNRYSAARRSLDSLDPRYLNRLSVNCI